MPVSKWPFGNKGSKGSNTLKKQRDEMVRVRRERDIDAKRQTEAFSRDPSSDYGDPNSTGSEQGYRSSSRGSERDPLGRGTPKGR